MNDDKAIKIVEAWFNNQADDAEYSAAIDYLAGQPKGRVGLAALFQTLSRPGGLSCQECRRLMTDYLDELERLQMPQSTKTAFLLHLAGCADCAEMFLGISEFEDKIDTNLRVPAFGLPVKKSFWPENIRHQIKEVVQLASQLKIVVTFKSVPGLAFGKVRGSQSKSNLDELILFKRPLGTEPAVSMELVVQTEGKTACTIVAKLEGAPLRKRPAGHNVILQYHDSRTIAITNDAAKATFKNIPLDWLSDIAVEIEINLGS